MEKEELNVQFNQIVYSIRRKSDRVLLKIQTGSKLEVVKCGFLIWGGPINPDFLRIADATSEEWNLFKGLKPIIFTANLGKVSLEKKKSVNFHTFGPDPPPKKCETYIFLHNN